MNYNPKDVENAMRLCCEHKYYLAVPRDIGGVIVPVCPKNFYMCEQAGRFIPQLGGPICKGALGREITKHPDMIELKSFLDDKLD